MTWHFFFLLFWPLLYKIACLYHLVNVNVLLETQKCIFFRHFECRNARACDINEAWFVSYLDSQESHTFCSYITTVVCTSLSSMTSKRAPVVQWQSFSDTYRPSSLKVHLLNVELQLLSLTFINIKVYGAWKGLCWLSSPAVTDLCFHVPSVCRPSVWPKLQLSVRYSGVL